MSRASQVSPIFGSKRLRQGPIDFVNVWLIMKLGIIHQMILGMILC